ncbi:phage portal protein [Lachnospiraceae bacterium ZAX-1]
MVEVKGLTPDENQILNNLISLWSEKLARNEIRDRYYEGKHHVYNIGISTPPQLRGFEMVTGWPAKAVDMLAARSQFDGFVYKGISDDPLKDVIRQNDLKSIYHQSTISELINSCVFFTVSKGTHGEPPIVINQYMATDAAATWNRRKKRIENGIVVTDMDGITNQPKGLILYTDRDTIELVYDREWKAERHPNRYGRPLIEPMVYKPSLKRPFGNSRISRAVMTIADNAARTALRTEISSEFYTSPQRYLLGADRELFDGGSRWDAYIGNIFAVSKPEDGGDMPVYGQLPQLTMAPHIDYMRSLAAQFAGETCIPISSLGVIHDNPASAEAMHAAEQDLIIEAENLNMVNGNSLKNIGLLALAMMENVGNIELLPEEYKTITPKFRSPARPSTVSQSDAIVKQVSAIPYLAETTVALEELGYNAEQITRIQAEKNKATATSVLNELMGYAKPEVEDAE